MKNRDWLTRLLVFALVMLVVPCASRAEMLAVEWVGDDVGKARLCAERSGGKMLRFEIDADYVARAKAFHPDLSLVVVNERNPQLVECYLRSRTGRYEPASYSPPQSFWRLPGEDPMPRLLTVAEKEKVAKVCLDSAPKRIGRSGFHHSVYTFISVAGLNAPNVGSERPERHDFIVQGIAFYGPPEPDLSRVTFRCLLSPGLAIKSVELPAQK